MSMNILQKDQLSEMIHKIRIPMKIVSLKEARTHLLRMEDLPLLNHSLEKHIFSNNHKEMWIMGSQHTKNDQSPLIRSINHELREFQEKNFKKPLILLEGFLPTKCKTLKTEVEKYQEFYTLYHYAQKKAIELKSIEPTETKIANLARKIFPYPITLTSWAVLNILSHSPNDCWIDTE